MKITIMQDGGKMTVLELTAVPVSYDLPPEPKVEIDYQAMLDWVFRQFNRVDGNELISLFHLRVPSLSMGDIVQIEDRKFRCEAIGWREL